jgi:hypothetical protein
MPCESKNYLEREETDESMSIVAESRNISINYRGLATICEKKKEIVLQQNKMTTVKYQKKQFLSLSYFTILPYKQCVVFTTIPI